jgi:hypothetical protein
MQGVRTSEATESSEGTSEQAREDYIGIQIAVSVQDGIQ